jgi:RNA polymerase sigma-70 factor (ECF subfamily)
MSERAGRVRPSSSRIGSLDLRALFERHYASIWRLLRRLGVSSPELDDAAQEVFWVAARRLRDIQPGREHPFLYGVALRIAANHQRRHRALPPLAEVGQVPAMVDEGPSPEEQLATRQERELLDEVLGRMPIDLRTVLVLFELEGLEVKQIAEIEQVPVGTASSRLRRAREEFSAIAKRIRAGLETEGWNR